MADAPIYKKIVLPTLTAFLGHPVQNICFALIKKVFLQTLLEIISRYNGFFLGLGPPYKQNESFYICGVGYQSRVKRVRGVNF